ncbi:MAG: HAD family hydrolase [Ruminococcaceae bacterium]|nr:HAD family hydrolase [Oscillospiraceae bacterium]
MKDIVFFDLDGTLTDSGDGIKNSAAYALNKFGIPVPKRDELNKFIGPPLVGSFRNLFGMSDEDADLAVVYYREYYAVKGIFENSLYDGVTDMLDTLKKAGRTIVLATSKPEIYANQILKYFNIYDYFTHVCGAEMDHKRTDKHEVIEYALETAGVTDRSRVVMVGDRLHDIQGAKKSHLDSIGVTFGYGSEAELKEAGADYIVNDAKELTELLLKL